MLNKCITPPEKDILHAITPTPHVNHQHDPSNKQTSPLL